MEILLIEKLRTYITHNNPDILVLLQSEFALNLYLEKKVKTVVPLMNRLVQAGNPWHVIEELCLVEMTDDLRPSRFHYLKKLLRQVFLEDYLRMQERGVLTYELVQLISYCQTTFEQLGFSQENEDDAQVRATLIDAIQRYLESK